MQWRNDPIYCSSAVVSAGKRDLVPEALTAIGVATLFHKVRLKPGKPLLFGVRPIDETDGSSADTLSRDMDASESVRCGGKSTALVRIALNNFAGGGR